MNNKPIFPPNKIHQQNMGFKLEKINIKCVVHTSLSHIISKKESIYA